MLYEVITDKPLWTPSAERVERSLLARFLREAGQRDYAALHRWSIENREAFWNRLWDFCAVRGEKGATTLRDADRMPGARWFPDARLNFADNLLRAQDDSDALVFV